MIEKTADDHLLAALTGNKELKRFLKIFFKLCLIVQLKGVALSSVDYQSQNKQPIE